jgi:hypothetical protein
VDADRLRIKWHLGQDKDDFVSLVVTAVFGNVLAQLSGIYTEVNGSFYGLTPDKEEIKEGIEKLSKFDEFVDDVPYYINPSVCLKKALWPF